MEKNPWSAIVFRIVLAEALQKRSILSISTNWKYRACKVIQPEQKKSIWFKNKTVRSPKKSNNDSIS